MANVSLNIYNSVKVATAQKTYPHKVHDYPMIIQDVVDLLFKYLGDGKIYEEEYIISYIDPYDYDNKYAAIKAISEKITNTIPNSIIVASAYASMDEFPNTKYFLPEINEPDSSKNLKLLSGKLELPLNLILDRQCAILHEANFKNINNFSRFEMSMPFIYTGSEIGSALYCIATEDADDVQVMKEPDNSEKVDVTDEKIVDQCSLFDPYKYTKNIINGIVKNPNYFITTNDDETVIHVKPGFGKSFLLLSQLEYFHNIYPADMKYIIIDHYRCITSIDYQAMLKNSANITIIENHISSYDEGSWIYILDNIVHECNFIVVLTFDKSETVDFMKFDKVAEHIIYCTQLSSENKDLKYVR